MEQAIEGGEGTEAAQRAIAFAGALLDLATGLDDDEREVDIYTAARVGELAALTAGDVDTIHARVSITKQMDRKTREDVKTRRGREGSSPSRASSFRFFAHSPTGRRKGASFTCHQRRTAPSCSARTSRPRSSGPGSRDGPTCSWTDDRLALRFHDLRHTGLTWMAVRGDESVQIQWRGGHRDMKTTQGYIDAGRKLSGTFGAPFPPLPSAVMAGFRPPVSAPQKRRTPWIRIESRAFRGDPNGN